jgi:2-polyprenyl-3-methyl-5-hydroxy-6-metoxy-1,4-benzoquinol methylase
MLKESRLQKNLKLFLNCKDHTVSGELYRVMKNQEYDFLVTSPVPSDLAKYYQSEDYISHTDAKKSLFDNVYQIVKRHTLKKKVALLNSFLPEQKTVLDIGAGTGDFLHACKKDNWKVVGVEPSIKAREIAKSKNVLLEKELSFFKGQKFDVITLWHVLEHVENLEAYTQSLQELLKENGTLLIAVPNYKSFDASHYGSFWAAFDVPRHVWHFSQTSIQKIFALVSLKVVQTIPMKFDAYYVSLLSEKYKNGKMNILKSFWIGFQSNIKAKRSSEYSSLIYVLKNN